MDVHLISARLKIVDGILSKDFIRHYLELKRQTARHKLAQIAAAKGTPETANETGNKRNSAGHTHLLACLCVYFAPIYQKSAN
jgi:hypothetical protein